MYPNSIYIGLKRSPHVGTLGGSGLWGQSIYYLGTCTLRVQPVHYDAETSWIHCALHAQSKDLPRTKHPCEGPPRNVFNLINNKV